MSRARKLGALALALACAGLVAGCGAGDGTTAAVEAPAAGTAAPAPAAGAAPAAAPTPGAGATNVIGAFAPADAASLDETIRGYDRFPRTRAGKIFVDPTVKPAPPAAPAVTEPAATAVTTVPATSTTPAAGSTGGTTTDPAPAPVATELVASIDVSGVVETARVGTQLPAASPQFTVESITAKAVTLKVNTGTFPGGSQTMELTVGTPVTLTNATTGVALTITVKTITPQAKTA